MTWRTTRWVASRREAKRSQRKRIHPGRLMGRENLQGLDPIRAHEPAIGRSADSHVRQL